MTKRRALTGKDRLRIFAAHNGICHLCLGKIDAKREAWEVSHDIPLEMGGADDDVNRKPAHARCHRLHTRTTDIPNIAKAKRRELRNMGAKRSANPMPGSRGTKWKRRMDGTVERRF